MKNATPGKWHKSEHSHLIHNEHGVLVASVTTRGGLSSEQKELEREANAMLIAGAKEMAEALKFYADKSNIEDDGVTGVTYWELGEKGEWITWGTRAREALKEAGIEL